MPSRGEGVIPAVLVLTTFISERCASLNDIPSKAKFTI